MLNWYQGPSVDTTNNFFRTSMFMKYLEHITCPESGINIEPVVVYFFIPLPRLCPALELSLMSVDCRWPPRVAAGGLWTDTLPWLHARALPFRCSSREPLLLETGYENLGTHRSLLQSHLWEEHQVMMTAVVTEDKRSPETGPKHCWTSVPAISGVLCSRHRCSVWLCSGRIKFWVLT